MKLRHSVKWMLIGVLAMPGLTACSSDGEEEEVEEVESSEEGNAAVADGAEGNENAENAEGAEGNVANAAEGNAANINEGNAAFEDANAGNMAAENGAANGDIPPELLNAENPAAGAENGLAAENATAGMENAAAGMENPAPTDAMPVDTAAAAPEAPPAPEAAPAAVPSGDSRVYYVSAASASLHNGPSDTAQTVGTLSKGDPVLVKIEGAWANVLNRGYVAVSSLSQTPVGRSSSGAKSWQ